MENRRLVEVSDHEVRIDFALGCKCRANVRLTSLSANTPIAFKVQTSSPQKFLVSPPTGLIPPLSSAAFQVILKPQSQPPAMFPRSPTDRFLIKTALAPEFSTQSTQPDSINSWFASRPTQDLKLKVVFVGPFLLRHAVAAGDVDAARNLIKRQKSVVAEMLPREAESLLGVASKSNEMVELLVEAGLKSEARAKIDKMSLEEETRWASKGWTGIHVAAAFDRTEELASLVKLVGSGPLDFRDNEGRTALHLAVSKGNIQCARTLVEAGADKDAKSKDGRTALYRAASNGDRPMAEMLIQMGADPTITAGHRDRSPLDIARDKGHKEIVEILEQGETVLTTARRGELKSLELLLQRGASINYRDQYGLTALHVAAIKGHKDVALLLIGSGLGLECQDSEGHAPLHLAVEGGSMETVEVLVDEGANINARSKRGATPLYMANALGYHDIAQFLVNRGASSSSLPPSSSPYHL
ncbi:serine/threonine-protein phosphatase 6 regulatory ankyrin repeat subunit A-like [Vitis riparia]|uniref:serine/threonine-protein phosphatase 6 regulatory ankyrin repeat subunit A-like n=1 Tax=Vitis riparia TaxID=96939 RepID=UPI00155AC72A|nr:serine/threonine-protein phosphatase 6 regulatory ankyrin repeat subunit A-like [Vitis riparia]